MTENKQIISNFVENNLSSIPTLAHQNIILKGWLIKVADSWTAREGDDALLPLLRIISQEEVFRCQRCGLVVGKTKQTECWKCGIQVCLDCENGGLIWLCEHLSGLNF